jgi:hypothetical protein
LLLLSLLEEFGLEFEFVEPAPFAVGVFFPTELKKVATASRLFLLAL